MMVLSLARARRLSDNMDHTFLAYALVLLGLILMAAEIFLPTGGILLVLATGALVAGIAMSFYGDTTQGLITLTAVFVLIPVLGPILLHAMPRTRVGKKLFLEASEEDASVAAMPVILELEQLRGRYGKTVSSLRPAGITAFDGRRVDTMSEGDMIEPGQWVRCIDVRAGRVIVRQVDRPPDLGDIDPTELG
jgi:membrane-bound ClpP family serine protease